MTLETRASNFEAHLTTVLNHLVLAFIACCLFAPGLSAETAPTTNVEVIYLTRDDAYSLGACLIQINKH